MNHLFGLLSRWTLIDRYIGRSPFERFLLEQQLPVSMGSSSNGHFPNADFDVVQRDIHLTLILMSIQHQKNVFDKIFSFTKTFLGHIFCTTKIYVLILNKNYDLATAHYRMAHAVQMVNQTTFYVGITSN